MTYRGRNPLSMGRCGRPLESDVVPSVAFDDDDDAETATHNNRPTTTATLTDSADGNIAVDGNSAVTTATKRQ